MEEVERESISRRAFLRAAGPWGSQAGFWELTLAGLADITENNTAATRVDVRRLNI
jgi:hypothetical protein